MLVRAKKMARSKAADNICFLFLLLLQVCSWFAFSHSVVKFLPGFQGPLPFYLETGYIGLGEPEEVQLFYYFVKSQSNPEVDPLLIWLNGGPGCSAFYSFIYENGPLHFEAVKYNGSLPTLILNPHTFTKVASIIYLDLPVGAGFSYATTERASQSSDLTQVYQAERFLRKWLTDHPEFLSNPFYVYGDSYSGITVPAVAQKISIGNEEGVKPPINLKGYLVGNPITDQIIDYNSRIPFAHGMGLISYELYESLKTSCGGEYQMVDPGNAECLKHLQAFGKCISGINPSQILEPICGFDSPRPGKRRSLDENSQEFCRFYIYPLAEYWANDNSVRNALHIREGTIGTWHRCNYTLPYTADIDSSIKYHAYLGKKGYRALVYSGDHDMVVPFLGTQAWIRSLNYSIIDDWREWLVEGQVAGYTRTYSNQLTFATVKGGGHTTPEYRPAECFAMFKRWVLQDPL